MNYARLPEGGFRLMIEGEPMSDAGGSLSEYKLQQMAERAADKAIERFCQRFGMRDEETFRDNLAWVREQRVDAEIIRMNREWVTAQRLAADGRRNETRKLIYTIIGSVIMLTIGVYVGTLKIGMHP